MGQPDRREPIDEEECALSSYRASHARKRSTTADLERPVALGLTGGVVVFMLTAVALSGAVNDFRVASFSFTAIAATFTGVVCLTVVLLYDRVPKGAARAARPLVAFVAWMLGLLLLSGGTRQGIQFIVVQTAVVGALLLAATARRVIGGRLDEVAARCFRFTASALIASQIAGAVHPGLKTDSRVSGIVAAVSIAWFLAEYRVGHRNALWWSVALILGIAISLSRIALLAAFVLGVATMLRPSRKQRARNAILCVLLVATGYWTVTSWSPLRDRFTQGDVSLSVAGVKINAEGRTTVWPVLWKGVWDEPLIGHGPGSASARSVAIDPAFDHPHNDYLRVLYDFGLIGFGLLAWFAVRTLVLLRRIRKSSPLLVPPLAALNAGLAVLIVMATDNPLDYPVVMIPVGALIGLGLGCITHAPRELSAQMGRRASSRPASPFIGR